MAHLQLPGLRLFLIFFAWILILFSSISDARAVRRVHEGTPASPSANLTALSRAELDARDLRKRVDDDLPTLEEARQYGLDEQELEQQIARGDTFAFYSELGGSVGIPLIQEWFCNQAEEEGWRQAILSTNILQLARGRKDRPYWCTVEAGKLSALNKPFVKAGEAKKWNTRCSTELASQVLAERARGRVLYFHPDPPRQYETSADKYAVVWEGWEYPVLQRNKNVESIWTVDPRKGQDGVPKLMWTRGKDKIDTPKPRGAVCLKADLESGNVEYDEYYGTVSAD